MKNLRIRAEAERQRVKLWEVAAALGITDATLSRRLRTELPPEEQQRILDIIDRIKERDAQ